MKQTSKIALGFVAFLGIAGMVFFNAEVSEQVSAVAEIGTEVKTITANSLKVSVFDCATAYDITQYYARTVQQDTAELTQMFIELMDNRCFITVESWAHESNFESKIWSEDWKTKSYQNQLMLGEVEPKDKGEQGLVDYFNKLKESQK